MPFVIVLEGKNRGQRYEFDDKAIIGRGSQALIRLSDDAISRQHARLYRSGDRYYIVDLGSSNGTKLNDESVSNSSLDPGDTIRLGGTLLRFEGDRVGSPKSQPAERKRPKPVGPAATPTVQPSSEGITVTATQGNGDETAPVIRLRDEALQFSPNATARNEGSILNQDFTQRSAGSQFLLVAILLVLTGAIGFGVFLLTSGVMN